MSYTPKFDYKEISAAIEAGQRRYDTPAGRFPSITTILGHTVSAEKTQSLQNWRNSLGTVKADAVSKAAADHGTNVHLLVERHFKGIELTLPDENGNKIPQTDVAAFNSIKMKLKGVDEVWGIEVPLYSETLRLAGRCDMIAKYKGKPSIIDIKTSTRLKSKEEIGDYALQLTFYAIAHNEMFDTDIQDGYILMAAAGGFPLEFHFTLDEHLDELVERAEKFFSKHKK